MMTPKVTQTFGATIELDERQVRVLNRLASYDARHVAAVLQEKICKDLDVVTLQALLTRLQPETAICIKRFDAAIRVFEGKDA